MDDCDRADVYCQGVMENFTSRRAAEAQAKEGLVSLTHCVECEEPIPEARRRAVPGCQLCVDCQAAQEK